jgi:MFS family permease
MERKGSLLFDKRFWPTYWTQFLGAFNDNVYKNAMVILITFKAYTLAGLAVEQMVALCGGVFILPFFLFSAVAGQICDKYPKHKLMVMIKVWEILVMMLGAGGFLAGNIQILMIALFLMGTQSTFFGPIKYSILPELIKERELVEGNALVQMGTFVAILVGTILGGYLISIEGNGNQIVSLMVIVFAILGTLTAVKIQKIRSNEPNLKIDWGLIRPTWRIMKCSWERKDVFLGVVGISWFWFYGAALLSLFPVYGKNILHSNEHVVTLFLGLFSVGVAIGSMVCSKLSKETLELGLVPIGALGLSLFPVDIFIIGKPAFVPVAGEFLTLSQFINNPMAWRIVFDLTMISLFSGFYIVPLYTLIQERSRSEIRSRIIAANNILNALFMVVASILLMLGFSKGVTEPQMFMALSAVNVVVSLIMFREQKEYLHRFRKFVLKS